MADTETRCKICGNTDRNTEYVFQERLFGTGETFPYFECPACGCLQIADVPEDMARFYPPEYTSHQRVPASKFNKFKRMGKSRQLRHVLGSTDPLGALLTKVSGVPQVMQWLEVCGATPDSSVLDVGCGAGNLLAKLWQSGMNDLTGIDPYIPEPIDYPGGVSIHKCALKDWHRTHDIVISNHSFEHVPDPSAYLKEMRDLLNPKGTIIIRVPVMGCYAWRTFGEHWAQLDAPRHLYLHTEQSLDHLARQHGLRVVERIYDARPRHLLNSLKSQRGIPVDTPNSQALSEAEIAEFKKLAADLNESGDGDQATFFLQ